MSYVDPEKHDVVLFITEFTELGKVETRFDRIRMVITGNFDVLFDVSYFFVISTCLQATRRGFRLA